MAKTNHKCKTMTGIILFCGGGGVSIGYRAAGIRTVVGVDSDAFCLKAMEANFPGAALANIELATKGVSIKVVVEKIYKLLRMGKTGPRKGKSGEDRHWNRDCLVQFSPSCINASVANSNRDEKLVQDQLEWCIQLMKALKLKVGPSLIGWWAVGRCRLTVSKPVSKAPMVSALETKM